MALTQKQYLNKEGLSTVWAKIKAYVDAQSGSAKAVLDTLNLTYEYVAADKVIVLKSGTTVIGSVDTTAFEKDLRVSAGEIIVKDGKQILKLTVAESDTPVEIDVDKLFSQNASDIKMADGTTVQAVIVALQNAKDDYKAADGALETKLTEAYGKADDTVVTNLTKAFGEGDTEVYDAISAIPTTEIEALFA